MRSRCELKHGVGETSNIGSKIESMRIGESVWLLLHCLFKAGVLCCYSALSSCLKRVRRQDGTHAVVVVLHVTPLLLPEHWHTNTHWNGSMLVPFGSVWKSKVGEKVILSWWEYLWNCGCLPSNYCICLYGSMAVSKLTSPIPLMCIHGPTPHH